MKTEYCQYRVRVKRDTGVQQGYKLIWNNIRPTAVGRQSAMNVITTPGPTPIVEVALMANTALSVWQLFLNEAMQPTILDYMSSRIQSVLDSMDEEQLINDKNCHLKITSLE